MSSTSRAHVGLDDILSVTSSAEAAAAHGDSQTVTPQSPPEDARLLHESSEDAASSLIATKTSTSASFATSSNANICSILNKSRAECDEKPAQSSSRNFDKELEPIKDSSMVAKSVSPSPSARSQSPNPCTSPKPPPPTEKKEAASSSRPKNLFASARKSFRKNKVKKQYTIANMYPAPMFKSMDLDSPDGSFSSMGFVGSALGVNVPFASQSSLNAAAARRARMAHNRAKSVISRNPTDLDRRGMYHSSGRLFRANSTRGNSAMASYDNLANQAANGGGSLHSPSMGLLGENDLQNYRLGGSVGLDGLDHAQHHSVPGSTCALPQTSPSPSPSPRYIQRSPPRYKRTRGLNRQVTLNPSCLSNNDNYTRRSPTSRLQSSLQTIPSQSGQTMEEVIAEVKSPMRQKSIMKQRSLPVNDEPPFRVLKDDQGFLKPNNVPYPPRSPGCVAQSSIDSHRSSISSAGGGNAPIYPGMPPCTSPGSPNSRPSGIIRQYSATRSPRSPNMSRQISKISDQISMIDEEAEDAIEAAAAANAVSSSETNTNGCDNGIDVATNGHEAKILPTSQRATPSFRQLSFMRSTAIDNPHRSFGAVGGGYFNSQSSRQGSFSHQSSGLKRQVTICEDSMSIPESVYYPTKMSNLRRSIIDHSTTSINYRGGELDETRAVNFQESDYSGPMTDGGLSRIKRRPFLRGSTMSMVARPDAATGFVTNNLGCYANNNNYSDAISVKSVQNLGGIGGRMGMSNNRSSQYSNIHIVCRDDDRDPLLSSLMSSPSKRSLSTKSLMSTTNKSTKGFGTIDPETLPQTTLLYREESGLTKEEIAGLRDAFAQFDSDGDGKLSRKEIEKAMGNMLSEADLDDLLTDLDGDGDGEVEWDEFLHAMKARMREPESIKALKEAFRVMTANSSDGVVEADVMRQFLLQCADNYGSTHNHRKSTLWTPSSEDAIEDDESLELRRSSSRIGLGSKLEELRRRERELELEEMLQALDLDRDGKVSLNDFIRLLILDQVEEETENDEVDDNETAKESKSKGKTNGEDTNGRTSSIDRKDSDLEDSNESRSRHKGCIVM